MNALQVFEKDGWKVRSVKIDGEIFFVGKDVAEALGYTNTSKALSDHCRGVTKSYPIVDSLGRTQEARIINEPDLYRLIVKSNLPEAQKFEAWVFEEVLPSIRKTGSYQTPSGTNLDIVRAGYEALMAELDTTKAHLQKFMDYWSRMGLVPVSVWGKETKIGYINIFRWMDERGYIWKVHNSWIPTIKGEKWLEVKESRYTDEKGQTHVKHVLFVNPEGRARFLIDMAEEDKEDTLVLPPVQRNEGSFLL